MPHYFFHLFDDAATFDEEGAELANVEAARVAGIQQARHMAADEVLHGRLHLSHWIEIADQHGDILHTIPFGRAFEIVE